MTELDAKMARIVRALMRAGVVSSTSRYYRCECCVYSYRLDRSEGKLGRQIARIAVVEHASERHPTDYAVAVKPEDQ